MNSTNSSCGDCQVSPLKAFFTQLLNQASMHDTTLALVQDNPSTTSPIHRWRKSGNNRKRRHCICIGSKSGSDYLPARESFQKMPLLEPGERWESEPMDSSSDHSNSSGRMRLQCCEKPRLPSRRKSPIFDETQLEQVCQ